MINTGMNTYAFNRFGLVVQPVDVQESQLGEVLPLLVPLATCPCKVWVSGYIFLILISNHRFVLDVIIPKGGFTFSTVF